jgi:RNA polymerase sigma factor (sigma-70 family)
MSKVPEMEWMFHNSPSPEEEMMAKEGAERVEKDVASAFEAIEALPERQKEVMKHMYEDGLGLKATAQIMGITPGAVHKLHVRAKKRVKIDVL